MLGYALWASAGLTRPDVASQIVLSVHANAAPFVSAIMAQGYGPEPVNEKVEWGKQSLSARTSTIDTAGYVAATTVISLASAAGMYPDCIVRFTATGETAFVTAVNYSTNDITVIRGVGSVAAADASVANGATVMNLGPAAGEGSLSPTERDYTPAKHFNYVQTFRKSVKVTGRFQRIGGITQDELPRRREVANKELLIDLDHQLIFGQKNSGATLVSSEGKRTTLMGGIREHIATNVDAIGGTATKARINTFAKMAFNKGADDKLWLCGPTAIETLNTHGEQKLQTVQGDVAVGLRLLRYITPYGVALLAYERNMTGATAGDIISVAIDKIKFRPTKDGKIALKQTLQTPGEDAQKEEWFGEMSTEFGDEEEHAIATGITGAA